MRKRLATKPLPTFASEAAEREFWETHDTSPYFDIQQARRAVFPNLRPSTETISLRLPIALLHELKELANRRDVPYQSLLKVFLAERLARENAATNIPPAGTHAATNQASTRPRKAQARSAR